MSSLLVYLGILGTLVGSVVLIKPLAFLRIGNRRVAGVVLSLGLALGSAAALWPVSLQSSGGDRQIDRFLPSYHFNKVHSVGSDAPPERILSAVKLVTPEEIRFARTLLWIRRLPGRLLGSAGRREVRSKPFLDVGDSPHSLILAETEREIVLGIVGRFWKVAEGASLPPIEEPQAFQAFATPGHVKAAMNFYLEDTGAGWFRVTTETRVAATDPSAARLFAAYWRVIYPGSSLLRVNLLEALKRRVEAEAQTKGS